MWRARVCRTALGIRAIAAPLPGRKSRRRASCCQAAGQPGGKRRGAPAGLPDAASRLHAQRKKEKGGGAGWQSIAEESRCWLLRRLRARAWLRGSRVGERALGMLGPGGGCALPAFDCGFPFRTLLPCPKATSFSPAEQAHPAGEACCCKGQALPCEQLLGRIDRKSQRSDRLM